MQLMEVALTQVVDKELDPLSSEIIGDLFTLLSHEDGGFELQDYTTCMLEGIFSIHATCLLFSISVFLWFYNLVVFDFV